MKKVLFLLLILGVASCRNPYIAPNTSKALTEKEQLEETKKQTVIMETINFHLARIAHVLEQLAKK